ncbi:phage tail protein [Magnetospirillum gryphiswaldense]|uniref:Microcystin dependent protein n=1 Tax=Magnetospirillum gryphiswaldense TaxID=55518 RepID=A4TXJ4_9PROT|nr:tail fiber protein [Magnetospirillum gryphiswaldense]AVM75440.1 Phage Tail Collar Domain protein [Magnetospirillum gryphiswaldense MSR-1]AVM79343.1 Phage Tail Collar Domain protein [Magnetospirillum gryphiswaldense]CAM75351.1 microcystin dependent protein [Magnetospirillum gryphiswaldense MSR-1]
MSLIISPTVRGLLAAATVTASLSLTAPAWACGSEPYIGEVCYFAFNWCPRGFLPADGTSVTTQQYTALYSLVGPYYGGTGNPNFTLPNLVNATPVQWGSDPSVPASLLFGKSRGSASQVLTVAQMPAHTHTATFDAAQGNAPLQGGMTLSAKQANGTIAVPQAGNVLATLTDTAATPGQKKGYAGPTVTGTDVALGGISAQLSGTGGVTVAPTGGAAVGTMPPNLALTACIVATGLYPPRP